MKIGLIDVDGHHFPSLPIMKLSSYHKKQGDEVEFWNGLKHYDRVYMSKVFDFTPDIQQIIMADEIIKGGTAYGLDNKLDEKIEHCYPDYALYGITDTAYGFLTRGCLRQCPFCIVSKKEGKRSVKVADLSEFWNGQRNIVLLDPNLLACKEADNLLIQLAQSRSYVDFTQGLDVRLLDRSRAELIKKIKVKMLHFAWDNPKTDLTNAFAKAKEWLAYDKRKMGVYVLVNYWSTLEEDLYRIYTLRDLGYSPYVMIYDKQNAPQKIRHLANWVNSPRVFATCKTFESYCP